jgi:hypothetical protein
LNCAPAAHTQACGWPLPTPTEGHNFVKEQRMGKLNVLQPDEVHEDWLPFLEADSPRVDWPKARDFAVKTRQLAGRYEASKEKTAKTLWRLRAKVLLENPKPAVKGQADHDLELCLFVKNIEMHLDRLRLPLADPADKAPSSQSTSRVQRLMAWIRALLS